MEEFLDLGLRELGIYGIEALGLGMGKLWLWDFGLLGKTDGVLLI